MIREYLDEALRRAHYEKPGLQGVLANADTFEECRRFASLVGGV